MCKRAVDSFVNTQIFGTPTVSNKIACKPEAVLKILQEKTSMNDKVTKILASDKTRADMLDSKSCLYSLKMMNFATEQSADVRHEYSELASAVDTIVSSKIFGASKN